MYYVYILKSLRNRDVYVGYSEDLRERVKYHNSGLVKATKPNMPWKLVYYEAYLGKQDATKRERQLKMHRAKEELKIQIKNSLE